MVVNTVTLRHVHPLPTLLQSPAQNTRQAKSKRTKVPGPRQRPPPACPAPAQPETQDKGLGQSEGDEGQRVDAAWPEGAVRERHWASLGTSSGGKQGQDGGQALPAHTSLHKRDGTPAGFRTPHTLHTSFLAPHTLCTHSLTPCRTFHGPPHPHTPLNFLDTPHIRLTTHINSSQGEKITQSTRHTEKSQSSHTHTSHHTHTHTQPPTMHLTPPTLTSITTDTHPIKFNTHTTQT